MNIKMKIANALTNMKVYLGRSNTYLNVINSISILFLATEKFKDYGANLNMYTQIIIAFSMFSFLILIGYLDTKFGLYKMETLKCANNNPQSTETLEIVKRIEDKINNEKSNKII